jgi:hypothetical protein
MKSDILGHQLRGVVQPGVYEGFVASKGMGNSVSLSLPGTVVLKDSSGSNDPVVVCVHFEPGSLLITQRFNEQYIVINYTHGAASDSVHIMAKYIEEIADTDVVLCEIERDRSQGSVITAVYGIERSADTEFLRRVQGEFQVSLQKPGSDSSDEGSIVVRGGHGIKSNGLVPGAFGSGSVAGFSLSGVTAGDKYVCVNAYDGSVTLEGSEVLQSVHKIPVAMLRFDADMYDYRGEGVDGHRTVQLSMLKDLRAYKDYRLYSTVSDNSSKIASMEEEIKALQDKLKNAGL